MTLDDSLTTEKLGKRFDNAFSLVNHAIGLAKNIIQRGEENDQNPANEVLDMIADERDQIDEQIVVVEEEVVAEEE